MLKHLLSTIAVLLLYITAVAQVTTLPAFIKEGYKGEIIVTFDPSQGNGGMVGATDCYAHTGLITEKSQNDGDWKYAPSKWLDKSEKYHMTKRGDLWELVIPNINSYYGCPENEKILRLAFVFNDGKANGKEGKAADNKDIFVDLVETDVFSVKFDNPTANMLMEKGSSCNFKISSSETADLSLIINEKEITTATSTTLSLTYTFNETRDYICVAKAATENETAYDTTHICVAGKPENKPRPEGLLDGITYYADDDTRATLSLYAKDINQQIAQNVFVIGDFSNWTYSTDYQMKQDGETGHFWLDINNLTPGKEYAYQYAVTRHDGSKVQISDPYTELVIDNDCQWIDNDTYPGLMQLPAAAQGAAAVLQTAHPEYRWSDATLNFKRPSKDNLVIYEVWVYDFSPYRTIQGLLKRFDYIRNLGVNAIELMPVCEFEGNISWGYNPTHYFALDKAYGTKEDFKAFVDTCHKNGIAVILDMVFNHCTGINPMNKLFPLKNNPYFNLTAPHKYKIFEDFNHEFPLTNSHFTRVLNYWLDEYKVDGFRMDVSHGLCGADCNSIVEIIDGYYQNGVKTKAGDAYFILEHWPWDDRPTTGDQERKTLVDRGMMCWTNINNAYSQTAMGWLSDDNLTPATYDGFITYCGSHDEERNFYKAKRWGKDNISTDTAARLSRIAANTAMNVMLNGPKMIWQYDEIGYDFSINYNSYNGKEEEAGRTSPKPMPEAANLNYLQSPLRMRQYQQIAQMLQLRTRIKPDIFSGNPKRQDVGSGKTVRHTCWGEGINTIFVISNLAASQPQTYTLPDDVNEWFDYLSDSPTATKAGQQLTLKPGEAKIWTAQYIPLPQIPDKYIYTDTIIAAEDNIAAPSPQTTLYPTITDGTVYLKTDNTPTQITVINTIGQTILKLPGHTAEINLSPLPKGPYMVIITYPNTQKAYKIYRR